MFLIVLCLTVSSSFNRLSWWFPRCTSNTQQRYHLIWIMTHRFVVQHSTNKSIKSIYQTPTNKAKSVRVIGHNAFNFQKADFTLKPQTRLPLNIVHIKGFRVTFLLGLPISSQWTWHMKSRDGESYKFLNLRLQWSSYVS